MKIPSALLLLAAASTHAASVSDTAQVLNSAPIETSASSRVVLQQISHLDVAFKSQDEDPEGAAEFLAYNKDLNRIMVVNSLDSAIEVFEIDATGALTLVSTIDVSAVGGPQSIAYDESSKVFAVAIDTGKDALGKVHFYDGESLALITAKTSGYLPDHVSFGPDGKCAYVANEGEPFDNENQDESLGLTDNVGGITQMCSTDFTNASAYADAVTVDFEDTDGLLEALIASDVHFALNQSMADLEPEYIAYGQVSENNDYEVYVGLQEANALAVFSVSGADGDTPNAPVLDRIIPFGFKDYGATGNAMDLFDDEEAKLETHAMVYGMYQPDTLKTYVVNDKTYIVMANEGDSKDWGRYSEEVEVSDDVLVADGVDKVDGLLITNAEGLDNDTYTKLVGFGARSFSIVDPVAGDIVFDSANQMSEMMIKYAPTLHNAKSGKASKMDARSPSKGVEPESVAIGQIGNATVAFVGFERPGVIGVWDISSPAAPEFHSINGHVDCDAEKSIISDPEAMYFIPAASSPVADTDLLVVSGSTSNTVTVFKVTTSSDELDLSPFGACPSTTDAPSTPGATGNPTMSPTPDAGAATKLSATSMLSVAFLVTVGALFF